MDPDQADLADTLRRSTRGREHSEAKFEGAVPVDSHLRRLHRSDAGQLLGVRDKVYGLRDALGDV